MEFKIRRTDKKQINKDIMHKKTSRLHTTCKLRSRMAAGKKNGAKNVLSYFLLDERNKTMNFLHAFLPVLIAFYQNIG
jgi:hypothetical protein